jgi:hypothetical protein
VLVVALQYFVDVFHCEARKSFARQAATNASVAADPKADRSSAKEIEMTETNEDRLAGTGEDPVVESGNASVAKKTSKVPVAETRKAFVVETREDSIAETRQDHPVAADLENPKKLGNGGVEAAASAASSFTGTFQIFAPKQPITLKSVWKAALLSPKNCARPNPWRAPLRFRATMPRLLTQSSWRIL